ncbi:flippase [Vibrio rumoiensis]|uniref:Flippase n=1 Tax=Vibrio rumoiensis TaxID=76258 RepID=A0ABW7ITF2_9VIBR
MKLFKNTNWLISERVISLFGGLLSNIYIARILGPEEFGKLNYLVATVILLQPLMKLGLHSIITRELCEHPTKHSEIIKTTFSIRMCTSILTFFGAIVSLYLIGFLENEMVLLFTILMIGQLFSPFEVYNYWFECNVNAKPVTISRTLSTLSFAVTKIIIVYLYKSLTALVIIVSIEFIMGYLVVYFCFKKYNVNSLQVATTKTSWKYALKLVKQSYWLVFSALAAAIYMKIDQVMLGYILTKSDVAIYSVAVKFSEMAYFIPVAIVTSLFPSIIKSKNEDSVLSYHNKLKFVMGGLFWLAFIGAVICTFISEKLITITYGDQYLESALLLNIHIWASLFVFVRALLSKWILTEKLYKFSLYTQGVGALTNIVLNTMWIPTYGAVGAAWATLFSVAMSSWLSLFLANKTRHMGYLMTVSPIYFIVKCLKNVVLTRIK